SHEALTAFFCLQQPPPTDLYTLSLHDALPISQVEENLNRVFTRVARWNAVLQFDECEIFLTERGDDLERSAIVGIFLRLLGEERSEEHTSELQSRGHLVCRLLLEKKNNASSAS